MVRQTIIVINTSLDDLARPFSLPAAILCVHLFLRVRFLLSPGRNHCRTGRDWGGGVAQQTAIKNGVHAHSSTRKKVSENFKQAMSFILFPKSEFC